MFVTNWISTTKIQKISEITNFFRHYFLSRTEVFSYRIFIQQEIKYVHKYDAVIVLVFLDEVACYHILHKTIVYT